MMSQYIVLQAIPEGLNSVLPFVLMIIVLFFFMIRPQMKRQKREKEFQAEVKKGTKVVTTSGIHGKIAEINETNNTVVIETGAGKIRFERSAISMDLTNKINKVSEQVKK